MGRLKDSEGKATTLRAICQSKNNYAEFDPPALLFELRDGFRWMGVDPDVTAEDLYDKKKNRGRPAQKKEDVKSAVLRFLDGGEPVLSEELEAKVVEATGCSPRTPQSAKKNLGIKCFQSERQWFCALPGQDATKHGSGEIL